MSTNSKSTAKKGGQPVEERYLPPYTAVGPYYFDGDSVYHKGSDDPVALTVNGIPYVHLCTIDAKTGQVSYVIRGYSMAYGNFQFWIQAKDLHSTKELCALLAGYGIVVMRPQGFVNYLKTSTQKIAPEYYRDLIHEPGWCFDGRAFFDGHTLIHSDDLSSDGYYVRPYLDTPVNVKGTLEDWKIQIGRYVEANPILLICVALAFASSLLARFGLASRIVNLHGTKGRGKTLALQVAATIVGNGIDPAAGAMAEHRPVVQKFETTMNGIEPVLRRSSPFLLPLDELTEQVVTHLAEMTYKLSSGAGKSRMTSAGEAAHKYVWCLTILTSSERSIAESVRLAKKALLGGQADRGVDIPVDRIGVLRDFGEYASFDEITWHLKKACGEFYGTPGRAFLRFVIDNPEHCQALIDQLPAVETELVPPGCGSGERRVVKHFAAAAIAACIANSAGILNCDYDQIMEAVRLVIREWWRTRGGALQRIGEYLLERQDAIHYGKPELGRVDVEAFIWDGNVIIPQEAFRLHFGDEAKQVLAELAALGALVTEQHGRHASRFCNNRLFAYVIPEHRVVEVMQHNIDGEAA